MIAQIILSFFISFFVIGGILLYFAGGGKIGLDDRASGDIHSDSSGNGGVDKYKSKSKPEHQKFHIKTVSRLGGAGIF